MSVTRTLGRARYRYNELSDHCANKEHFAKSGSFWPTESMRITMRYYQELQPIRYDGFWTKLPSDIILMLLVSHYACSFNYAFVPRVICAVKRE